MKRALALAFPLFLLLVAQCASASLPTGLSIQTDKPYYQNGEIIRVYGRLTTAGTPVPNSQISLEIQDPKLSSIIAMVVETNASGDYALDFRLSGEALLGTYSVYATCNYGGTMASNNTSFELRSASVLAVTVNTNGTSFMVGDGIRILGTVTLDGGPAPQAQVAVEILDPNNDSISVRVLQTDANANYSLNFTVPDNSKIGNYTIHVSASYNGLNAVAVRTFELKPRKLPADINGDGKVNIIDISLVAHAWGSRPGESHWDPRCDLDSNSVINIIDITLVAKEFRI